MLNEAESIKTGYETLGLSPEDIAADRQLEVTAVKACLMNVSGKYRRDCGKEEAEEDRLNFSDNELEDANKVIVHIMKYASDENLQLKAATYIRDDKKGRKEVVKGMQDGGFNLFMFNESLAKIREGKDKLVASITDVTSSTRVLG